MTAAELLAHELAPVALNDGEHRLLAALVAGEMAPSYATEIRVSQMAEQIRTYAERQAGRREGDARPEAEPKSAAEEQLAAYHAMRPPTNLTEHLTAAALLGLDLKERELVVGKDGQATRMGPTLRERIAAYWGAPPAAASHRRQRGPARIPDDVIRRNAARAKEYAP
jgi:hypothetical protein